MSATPAKLVCGVLAPSADLLNDGVAALVREFGEISQTSPDVPFGFTDYYESEMGAGLTRRWVGFAGTVARDELADLKLTAIGIEDLFRKDGRRQVNLDPGLLTLHSLVLASTKDFTHRIYLRDGIYAEVTLMYQSGGFKPLAWTYPDYQSAECLGFLTACRRELLSTLAHRSSSD